MLVSLLEFVECNSNENQHVRIFQPPRAFLEPVEPKVNCLPFGACETAANHHSRRRDGDCKPPAALFQGLGQPGPCAFLAVVACWFTEPARAIADLIPSIEVAVAVSGVCDSKAPVPDRLDHLPECTPAASLWLLHLRAPVVWMAVPFSATALFTSPALLFEWHFQVPGKDVRLVHLLHVNHVVASRCVPILFGSIIAHASGDAKLGIA